MRRRPRLPLRPTPTRRRRPRLHTRHRCPTRHSSSNPTRQRNQDSMPTVGSVLPISQRLPTQAPSGRVQRDSRRPNMSPDPEDIGEKLAGVQTGPAARTLFSVSYLGFVPRCLPAPALHFAGVCALNVTTAERTDAHRRLIAVFKRHGFTWGGTFLVPDPMHSDSPPDADNAPNAQPLRTQFRRGGDVVPAHDLLERCGG